MIRKSCFTVMMMAAIVLMGSAFSQGKEAEKKTDETKITGVIVQIEPDPSGKLAPLAIKTEKEQYPLAQNALTVKMAKYVGKKAKVTGRVLEVDSKKAFEPWLYERQDDAKNKSKFKQPTE